MKITNISSLPVSLFTGKSVQSKQSVVLDEEEKAKLNMTDIAFWHNQGLIIADYDYQPEAVEEVFEEDTPAVDTPAVDTPAVDTPAVDTPAVDTPAVDTPAVDEEEEKEDTSTDDSEDNNKG